MIQCYGSGTGRLLFRRLAHAAHYDGVIKRREGTGRRWNFWPCSGRPETGGPKQAGVALRVRGVEDGSFGQNRDDYQPNWRDLRRDCPGPCRLLRAPRQRAKCQPRCGLPVVGADHIEELISLWRRRHPHTASFDPLGRRHSFLVRRWKISGEVDQYGYSSKSEAGVCVRT